MNEKQQPSKFVLDPATSRYPRPYAGQDSLWAHDIQRIVRLIKDHIEEVEKARKDRVDAEHFPLLSIAIFGPIGSGKSSLLHSLRGSINDDNDNPVSDAVKPRLYSLPVLDPTTWGDSDHFIYAFLAQALEEDKTFQRERGPRPHESDERLRGLTRVQLAFQEVNEYLRVVHEPESAQEYDPLGLSLQKLERHTSGIRLRQAIQRFLAELAKTLDVEKGAVILPIDDLDLAPDHLVPALRAYQSYLLHPKLVPVFTFTDRMAEELIQVYFQKKLTLESQLSEPRIAEGRAGAQANTEVPIPRNHLSEQLAVQFLTRCFPVRNRIRLGPAPGRVQRADYHQGVPGDADSAKSSHGGILNLLVKASYLLYGHPDREDAHAVRAALRPSTLRRQIQVFDAMVQERVEILDGVQFDELTKPEYQRSRKGTRIHCVDQEGLKREYKTLANLLGSSTATPTWTTMFSKTAWSLLNVHRDTLRDLGLHLEDLYSWSNRELRTVILDRILTQKRSVRQVVLDRWFNRTDFRRSQVLSLLAANAFRPWMPGEEPYGDEQTPLWHWDHVELLNGNLRLEAEERTSITATGGLLWFLNVMMGFYLPQIMVRDWADALSPEEVIKERISGNGWDLHRGPVNAIRVAVEKQNMLSFGMMFLECKEYEAALKIDAEPASVTCEGSSTDELLPWQRPWRRHLLLRAWTCCGNSKGRIWSAVSLWRGLGLIGTLLELGERIRYGKPPEYSWEGIKAAKNKEKEMAGVTQVQEAENAANRTEVTETGTAGECDFWCSVRDEIVGAIRSHCLNGLVPGSLLGRESKDGNLQQTFPAWAPDGDLHEEIVRLAWDVLEWLKKCQKLRLHPVPAKGVWIGWKDCFLRRVHGEYILGSLWPRLGSRYLEAQPGMEAGGNGLWTAAIALEAWSETLVHYWRGCREILSVLLTCPLFPKSADKFEKDKWSLICKVKNNEATALDTDEATRGQWLKDLDLGMTWDDVLCAVKRDGTTPREFCIRRVAVDGEIEKDP